MSYCLRLLHTVRYLRPVQIYRRVWFRLVQPQPDLRPAPGLREALGCLVAMPRREASLVGPNHFRFLGQARYLSGDHRWQVSGAELLWLYNLHYFDDLNAEGASQRQARHAELIDDWIAWNRPGKSVGWDPYPLSLRIVNWIKWFGEMPQRCTVARLDSLAAQVRYLSQRLEYHLLGNHFLANAKALILAGLFFEGPEADRFLQIGLKIYDRQLPEQILPDGGHFERSPMYHSIILEDLLDLLRFARAMGPSLPEPVRRREPSWRAKAERMLQWLSVVCHPDGQIALFNDAALGIATEPEELFAYARRLDLAIPSPSGDGLTRLEATGYLRMQNDRVVALLDVAPIGPDYLPGHAHADTLSFELSLDGHRLFVDSGTSCYGRSAERLRQRSTAAHNTVMVDWADSSEVWDGFRVARRAYPRRLEIDTTDDEIAVACSHDGYRRLPGKVEHRRRWRLLSKQLEIVDTLKGNCQAAEAAFHLHPDVTIIDGSNPYRIELQTATGPVTVTSTGARMSTQPSSYHPQFGVSRPTMKIVSDFEADEAVHRIVWSE